MTVAQAVIQTVEWSKFDLLDGPATEFGSRLAEFIGDGPGDQKRVLWGYMENHVFSQDDIYSAAEPALLVLLAALVDESPRHVRVGILDLIFHIVQAASYRSDDLGKRCMEKAAGGSWLLVREALVRQGSLQDVCLEILDISAPDCARFVRLSG